MSCCFECRKQWEGKHRHENNIDLLITPGIAKNAQAFLYIYEKRCDKKAAASRSTRPDLLFSFWPSSPEPSPYSSAGLS